MVLIKASICSIFKHEEEFTVNYFQNVDLLEYVILLIAPKINTVENEIGINLGNKNEPKNNRSFK